MNILIISGTPKTEGLTFSFVKAAEETVKNEGAAYETVALPKLGLSKCKMCGDGWGICNKQHICEFGDKDGFNDLQEKVKKADAFVFITPVYWGEVSEGLKAFLDKLRRCQATKQWNKQEGEASYLKGKPSILVAVAGGSGGGVLNTLSQLERAIGHMGGDSQPKGTAGIFDHIGVNRWNEEHKRTSLIESIKKLIQINKKTSG